MTDTDHALIRRYLAGWDQVNDVPLTTPGPEAMYTPTGDGLSYPKDALAQWKVVENTLRDQAREEKVKIDAMSKLLIHVYRHGYEPRSFRWSENPVDRIPRGLVDLGFDVEACVTLRLRRFCGRLLVKIDEATKLAVSA